MDPSGSLDGVGDGLWKTEEEETSKLKDDEKPCESSVEREYLIITFWNFDEAQGLLEVKHEYTVEAPIIK